MDGRLKNEATAEFLHGDAIEQLYVVPSGSCSLVVSSPPYNIRKLYERNDRRTYDEYISWQREVAKETVAKLTPDGSLCWQVGTYVSDGEIFPLDIPFVEIFRSLGLKLRNRIIWRYNFGLNADRRFSGRYETLLWFTKSDDYYFNLDPVRIPQLYPGKRHGASKGAKAGLPSGNPLGKNPSDYWEFLAENDFKENPVWDIPNVKSRHPERTDHPCQFPVELVERCVLALTRPGDTILDPFVGTGATAIAALKHQRNAIGVDREFSYLEIARKRLAELAEGILPLRPLGKPVRRPKATEKVAKVPDEWRMAAAAE
ncbi:DNA-methyltransferase [Aminobacter carboxidus]|uniref:Methyltransferase n=1 Tax=Aminobacter carboxidus TaxID=376165 RepID=A0ABR9GXG9_9HYPH|nr:site-specific DNA-methyltransferase [Aminobacter carboxidus]MBE1208379.1 site-specific DNA-methyltransferase [Aminobacter carboxidus]